MLFEGLANGACPNSPQFPLNFGDGVNGDFTVEHMDFLTSLAAFAFGTKTDGYYKNGFTYVNTPAVGLYVPGDPTTTMSFLSWMRYFTSSGSYTLTQIQCLAITGDQSSIVVVFGPTFQIAKLDLWTGEVNFSGTTPSLDNSMVFTYQGVATDTLGYTYITYNKGSDAYTQKFTNDFTQSLWSIYIVNGAAQSVHTRASDNLAVTVSNVYSSTYSVQNSLDITTIDSANLVTDHFIEINSPYLVASNPFHHVVFESTIIGGCFDFDATNYASGYFYWDLTSNTFRVKGHIMSATTKCLGFYLFSQTQVGYFYRYQTADVYRLAIINNALSSSTIDLYKMDYSTQARIPTVTRMFRKDMDSYYLIGSFTSGSGKKVGLIEFSDGATGTFSCYTPPQPVFMSTMDLANLGLHLSTATMTASGAVSSGVPTVESFKHPTTIQTQSSHCSTTPTTNTIIPPASFSTTKSCAVGLPCVITMPSAFTLQSTTLSTCNAWVPNDLMFSLWDSLTHTTVFFNQLMASNIYTYTFTPLAAEAGTSRTHAISVDQSLMGYSIAKDTSARITVNVGTCTIVPPSSYPTTMSCYHSETCTISIPNPYSYNLGGAVCTPVFYFRLDDVLAGTIEVSNLFFADNKFTWSFTPPISSYPGTYHYRIFVQSFNPITSLVFAQDSSVNFMLTIQNRCAISAPTTAYQLTSAVIGDSVQTITFAPFVITPSYCIFGISYAITLPDPFPSYVYISSQDSTGFAIMLEPSTIINQTFTITGTATGIIAMSATATWDVSIAAPTSSYVPPANTAPYFNTEPDATLEVECNKKVDYMLDSIMDDEGDGVTASINAGTTVASLATLKSDNSAITFNPVCRANLSTDLTIKLIDDNVLGIKQRVYTIAITTLYIPPVTKGSNKPSNTGSSTVEDEEGDCDGKSTLSTYSGSMKTDTQFDTDLCQMIFPDFEIYSDEKSVYELPKKLFSDSSSVIEMRTREINGFLTLYKQGVFTLQPETEDIGNYTVTVRLIDKASMQLVQSSMFQFHVISSGKNPKNGGCPSKQAKDCAPRISSVSMEGVLTLYFPYSIMTYQSDIYQNITKTLQLIFIPFNASTSTRLTTPNITSYEVASFDQQYVTIKLEFSSPLEVSAQDGYADQVSVQFAENKYFGSYDNSYRVAVGYSLLHDLPQQYDSNGGASKKTQVVFKAMEKGMTSSLIVNFFLAAFLGIAMKQIWGIINTLQILTFMPLMIPQLPSNFQVCLQILQDVSNLNVVPKSVTDWFIGVLDHLKFSGGGGGEVNLGTKQSYYQSGTVQEEGGARRRLLWYRLLNSTGNETSEIIEVEKGEGKTKLMDNIAYIILGVILVIILLIAIFACVRVLKKYPKILKMITNLKDKIVFGVLITTVTKGYLKLTLSFMKTLSAEDETQESEDQQQQSWAPVIFLLLFTTIPLATLFFLLYNHSQLEKPKFKTMWGALYTNLSMSKAAQYTFNVWFMARRFVYAISIAGFFSSISMINVLLQILLSFFLILYLFKVRPFDTPRDNHIEIVNEITIICSFYCTLGVITDDTNLTGEVKYAFGFGMIGLVLFNVVFNFTIFLSNLVMQLITKIKAALQKHREKKAAKLLEFQMERSINTLSHLTQEINMDKQKPSKYNITDEERAKITLTQPKKDVNLMETQETLQLPKIVFQAETYNDFVQRKLKDKVKKGILNTGTIQGMSTDQLVAPRTRLDPISLIGKMAANGEAKLLQLSPLENDDFATKANSGNHSQAQSYSVNDVKLSTPQHQQQQMDIQKLSEVKTNSPAPSKQPMGLGRLGILNDKSVIIPSAFSLNEVSMQERNNSFKVNQRPIIPQIQLMNNNVFGEEQRERAYSGASLADRVKHENNNLLRVSFQAPL